MGALTRTKDGREWRIGVAADIDWIRSGLESRTGLKSAVPMIYDAYCTVHLPECAAEGYAAAQELHDDALVRLLACESNTTVWWLGYLDVGSGEGLVFEDAPTVDIYEDWQYVVVKAGPHEARTWRASTGPDAPWKGAVPDLMFPTDRSWLYTMLWDDHFAYVGGRRRLIAAFKEDPVLRNRIEIVPPPEPGAVVEV